MLFNSFDFLVFFALVFGLQLVLPHRPRNLFLLSASYFFYGSWDWRFLSLILLSTALDYSVGIALHREDGCYVTPYEDSPRLKRALTASPSVEIKGYSGGGGYRGRECGPRDAHGFRGIESRVVADIAAWIKRQVTQPPLP